MARSKTEPVETTLMENVPSVTELMETDAYYTADGGAAYLGDSRKLLGELPDESVDLVVTSPPFALNRKKEYGNKDAEDYNDWFMEFVEGVYRILKPEGSFVVDIGGGWEKGKPVRSTYHFELLTRISNKSPFHLAQDFYWYNPAKLPTPAQWVTIERIRVKDAVNHVWWFSKTERPEADNRRVLKEYSDSQKKLMKDGYVDKKRPSGHDISDKFDDPEEAEGAIRPNFWSVVESSDQPPDLVSVLEDAGVSQELIDVAEENGVLEDLVESVMSQYVDDNVLKLANTASNTHYLKACRELEADPHPARFPRDLPEFFIQLLTENPPYESDDEHPLVLDIFAGSNITGRTAANLERNWISFERQEKYIQSSQLRFMDMNTVKQMMEDDQSDFGDFAEIDD